MDVDEKTKDKNLGKSIYMFGHPRQKILVDQPTNNKMPVTDELKKFIMSVPAVELQAGQAQEISTDFMPGQANKQRYEEMELDMNELKANREFMAQQAKTQQSTLEALQK